MGQIRITPEELYQGEGEIRSLAQNIEQDLTHLKQIVDGVCNNWEGAARSSYFASFEEMHKQFKESFPPAINGLAEQMKAAAQAIEQTDAEIAKAFSAK